MCVCMGGGGGGVILKFQTVGISCSYCVSVLWCVGLAVAELAHTHTHIIYISVYHLTSF